MKNTFFMLLALGSFAASANDGMIKIYDAKGLILPWAPITKKGKLVMEDGKKVKRKVSPDAIALNKTFEQIKEYYKLKHNRNSWDDKGAAIHASVNVGTRFDIFRLKQNAAWIGDISNEPDLPESFRARAKNMGERFIFGAGKDEGLKNFESALDVVGHEFTHAVIDSTSKLEYKGQSGALNEHLADVFGVLINQYFNQPTNPFLIGQTVLGSKYSGKYEALRDMTNPEKGLSAQPTHMKDLALPAFAKYGEGCVSDSKNDNCGVHILSGIPNRMSALVMKKLQWEESTILFYNVMTKKLKSNSKFADYKVALLEECQNQSADVCAVVDEALKTVGM